MASLQSVQTANSHLCKSVYQLLGLAFTAAIPAFQNEWRHKEFNRYSDEEDNYLAFEETILEQVVDLREMDEAGLLFNELRYFGLDSPRGNCWYNFDSVTYLKCAAAGFDNSYKRETDNRITQNQQISWRQVRIFFWCGQIYE